MIPQQRNPTGRAVCRCGEAIRLVNRQLGATWEHPCGSTVCADGVGVAVPAPVGERVGGR